MSTFRKKTASGALGFSWFHLYPFLDEFVSEAGTASGHYFHQDRWAARRIFQRRPIHHVDIGFRIDGFVSHLLTFMPVTVVDIRPLSSKVRWLTFIQGDAKDLTGIADNSIESLSCLHAVEHFGLGRYGDEIDPDAWYTAIQALIRVLRPGGHLYFSTLIWTERVNFNAHRVFSVNTITSAFTSLQLISFSFVDDNGDLIEECDLKTSYPVSSPAAFSSS